MNETKPAGEHKLRALICDDTEDITNMFAALLRQSGYDVVATFSAPAALTAAQSQRFDLVIADIGMPGINGYELASQLRALPEYRSVPLIAVTGFAEYDDKEQALAAGFSEYMRKPVEAKLLMETIARLRDH